MRKYYRLLSALFVSIGVSISIPSQAHSYPLQNANQDYKQCQYCNLRGKQYKTVSSSTILTSVNGHNLTQGMFDDARVFGEFLAGKKFTPSEVNWLKKVVIKDFSLSTVSQIQSYNKLAKLLSEIRQLNPILQAKFREQMLAEMYLKLLTEKKLNEPSIFTLVYKHSPVIAVDPTNKVVVTKRAIESYFELHNFTEQLLGRPLLSNQVKKEVLLGIQKQFHKIPLENKIKLAESESNWLNLQQLWSNSSQEYKLQKVAQLREIVKNPKLSEPWTLLNITLKSQVYSGRQNNFIPPFPAIPTFSDFPAPIRFGN
jgi:hypothetical protein